MRTSKRRVAATLCAAILALGTELFTAAPGSAAGDPTCPHGTNTGSTACVYGVIASGYYTQFHSNNMYFTNTYYESLGSHINQTIWAYSGAPCSQWIELGLTQGYRGDITYGWYWAHQTNLGYDDHYVGNATPDGGNHTYQVSYGGGVSTAYLDGAAVGSIGGLGNSCIGQTGLEISSVAVPDTHSDTFDMNPLEWRDTSGYWHHNWNTSQLWIEKPCGQGYSPPNCLNGVYYSADHWADNKP